MKKALFKSFSYLMVFCFSEFVSEFITSGQSYGLMGIWSCIYLASFMKIDIEFFISLEFFLTLLPVINLLLPESMRFFFKNEDISLYPLEYFFWQFLSLNIIFLIPLIFDFLVKKALLHKCVGGTIDKF